MNKCGSTKSHAVIALLKQVHPKAEPDSGRKLNKVDLLNKVEYDNDG